MLERQGLSAADTGKKGLACLSLERRQEIASMGGRTAQAKGTAHQWTAEEARDAAKKGLAARRKRKEHNT